MCTNISQSSIHQCIFIKNHVTSHSKMVLRAVGAVLYSCSRSTCLICTATCPLTFTVELILSGSTRPRRWWTLQSLYAGWWRYLVMQSIGWVGEPSPSRCCWCCTASFCYYLPKTQAFWLTSLYLMLQQYWAPLRVPARDGVCAVLAVFAQLFMTQAGIVYAASCEQGAHVDKNKVGCWMDMLCITHTYTNTSQHPLRSMLPALLWCLVFYGPLLGWLSYQ